MDATAAAVEHAPKLSRVIELYRARAFDLSGLDYIDSAGIAVLLGAAAECAVRLRDPSPAVRRVVELTGLTDVLPVAS